MTMTWQLTWLTMGRANTMLAFVMPARAAVRVSLTVLFALLAVAEVSHELAGCGFGGPGARH